MYQNPPYHRNRGFTLVELMIVISILAILAAIALPKYQNIEDEARITATASNVRSVRQKITESLAGNGGYPPTIDATWFVNGLTNPSAPAASQTIEYDLVATSAEWQPVTKGIATGGLEDAYWYNPTNGAFRARVAEQPSDAQTLALYNRVNNTSLSALNETGP